MIEEKKNLTENMEMDAEDIEQISGGAEAYDPGPSHQMCYRFTEADVVALASQGYSVRSDRQYTITELNGMGIPGGTADQMKTCLRVLGVRF